MTGCHRERGVQEIMQRRHELRHTSCTIIPTLYGRHSGVAGALVSSADPGLHPVAIALHRGFEVRGIVQSACEHDGEAGKQLRLGKHARAANGTEVAEDGLSGITPARVCRHFSSHRDLVAGIEHNRLKGRASILLAVATMAYAAEYRVALAGVSHGST